MSNKILSSAELADFRRDGVIVPRYRLSARDLAQLQEHTARLRHDNPDLLSQAFVSPHIPHPGITNDHAYWMGLARHPDLLDLMEEVIGPDIILYGSALFYKEAGTAPETSWHQDGISFPIIPLKAYIIWMAVYDSVLENGALRVVKGTHSSTYEVDLNRGAGTFAAAARTIREGAFNEADAETIEVAAGQMILFDSMLIHGAHSNKGTRSRAGFAARYMPATSYYDYSWAERAPELFAPNAFARPIFLAKGVDRTGRNEFARGQASPA